MSKSYLWSFFWWREHEDFLQKVFLNFLYFLWKNPFKLHPLEEHVLEILSLFIY